MKTFTPPPAAPLANRSLERSRSLHPSRSIIGLRSNSDRPNDRAAGEATRPTAHLTLVPTDTTSPTDTPPPTDTSPPPNRRPPLTSAPPSTTTRLGVTGSRRTAPTASLHPTSNGRTSTGPVTTDALRTRNEDRCWRLAGPANPLTGDDLDWDAVGDTPLDAATIACLVYMRDVEGFTDQYVVGFAGHPTTLADPVIAAFVPTWQAEEAAHSALLDRFLRTYAAATGTVIPAQQQPAPVTVPLLERVAVQLTRPVGHVIAATHMVWGAANELLTLNGYRLLARSCGHPVLSELLGQIAAQESRHYSFYALQAEWRLRDSALARWSVRRLLVGAWTPVGIGDGYKSRQDFDLLLRHLVPGAEGERAIKRMDARFDRLPGLTGLDIFTRTVEAAA